MPRSRYGPMMVQDTQNSYDPITSGLNTIDTIRQYINAGKSFIVESRDTIPAQSAKLFHCVNTGDNNIHIQPLHFTGGISSIELVKGATYAPTMGTQAELTTALGANANLTFTAVVEGMEGNNVTIEYRIPTEHAQPIMVIGNDVIVNLATNQGNIVTTANDILTAIEAMFLDPEEPDPPLTVALAQGSSGVGVVSVMAQTSLAGATESNEAAFNLNQASINEATFKVYPQLPVMLVEGGTTFTKEYMSMGFSSIEWIIPPGESFLLRLVNAGEQEVQYFLRMFWYETEEVA